jgi:hypothetical protein
LWLISISNFGSDRSFAATCRAVGSGSRDPRVRPHTARHCGETKKCTQPFSPGKGAKCCVSDFSTSEFKKLCGVSKMEGLKEAKTVDAYLSLEGKSDWRTTIYQDGSCSTLMTHMEFIDLAMELEVDIVSELVHSDLRKVSGISTKTEAASKFAQDHTDKSVDPTRFYPTSMEPAHVKEWLSNTNYKNAVFRYGPGLMTGEDTWHNTYKDIFEDLLAETTPIKYASVAMNELLTANDATGGVFSVTAPTQYLISKGIKIWAWTFEDWSFKTPLTTETGSSYDFERPEDKWRWHHGDCLSEGKFDTVVYKDADELLILHALFEVAKVDAVFSAWPSTVSAYVSCVAKRPATVIARSSEASFVTPADSTVGFMRCSKFTTKSITQSSAAPCATVQITSKVVTNVPLFKDCVTSVQIAGLTGSCTDMANFVEAEGKFRAYHFNQTTGSLQLTVLNTTQAGCEYTMMFDVTHPVDPSISAVVPTIHAGGITIGSSLMDVPSDSTMPMWVDVMSFETYEIWQSSSFPCDENTISVTLTTKDFNLSAACQAKVTLTGFKTALNPDGPINVKFSWLVGGENHANRTMSGILAAGKIIVDVPQGPSDSMKLEVVLFNPKDA